MPTTILHADLDPTAESEDRLFTTLGTTTRRADMDRRDVLVTDTVGFISDLPHWLVESFKSTLDAVYRADPSSWSSTSANPSRRYARSWSRATTPLRTQRGAHRYGAEQD